MNPDDAARVLASHRAALDDLDRRLLDTLVERMRVCMEIARLKSEHEIPMMQPARVGLVLDRARKHAEENGLPPEYFGELFERIVAETCAQEDLMMSRIAAGERP